LFRSLYNRRVYAQDCEAELAKAVANALARRVVFIFLRFQLKLWLLLCGGGNRGGSADVAAPEGFRTKR